LIQLSECSSIETDILYSIIYGAVIFPVGIAWINDGGWLCALGFLDPVHSSCTYLISAISGLIGNIMIGSRFENKNNVFNQTFKQKT